MSRTSYEPEGLITYKKPPPRRRARATWAPHVSASRRPSFVAWQEMVEPRFPRPPRMPRDLKAPVAVSALESELLDDDDVLDDEDEDDEDDEEIWTLEPWSRPLAR
jgi:hypothetical protein